MVESLNPLNLGGKTVLVTGASSGIGRATAVLLGRLDARVILAGRREDALRETLDQMEGTAGHAVAPFDLARVDDVPAWLKGLVASMGAPIDGVVHCAGVSEVAPLRVLTRQKMDAIFVPNVYASLGILRGVASKGVAGDCCSVVLLSSVASMVGEAGLAAYSGSKGALNAIARSAAKELAPRKIRVNCIVAGLVETPMHAAAKADLTAAAFARVADRHILGLPRLEDVTTAAAYLLADGSRGVTGTTLTIDGGYLC